jgi:phospholipase/carboxylesterase
MNFFLAGALFGMGACQTQKSLPPDSQTQKEKVMTFELKKRRGEKPQTGPEIPHQQLSDNSPPEVYAAFAEWLFGLDDVREGRSLVSTPSARAVFTRHPVRPGHSPEFTHIHTEPGPGSQHLGLSKVDAEVVLQAGWGEPHPLNHRIPNVEMILIYAPRDLDELETIKLIALRAREYAEVNGTPAHP